MRDAHDKTHGRNAWDAFEEAGRFFMGRSPVHRAMHRLCALLDDNAIPYAVVGAMALNIHGFNRVTTDVDVLVTRDGLARLKSVALGRGYLEKHPGMHDLGDVQKTIVALHLPRDYAVTSSMDASVHAKWDELWQYAQIQAAEDF